MIRFLSATLLCLLLSCLAIHPTRRAALAPTIPVGVWDGGDMRFFTRAADPQQAVCLALEFWRYPPLQGEKKVGYAVIDGHWQDTVFVSDSLVYFSFADTVARSLTVALAATYRESTITHPWENVDSVVYVPAIVGTMSATIGGGLWGTQTIGREFRATRTDTLLTLPQ